jgi:hypothetical protein
LEMGCPGHQLSDCRVLTWPGKSSVIGDGMSRAPVVRLPSANMAR